jgi:hypothetical protein
VENARLCSGKKDEIGTILSGEVSGSTVARRTYAAGVKSDEGFVNGSGSGVTATAGGGACEWPEGGGGSGVTGG